MCSARFENELFSPSKSVPMSTFSTPRAKSKSLVSMLFTIKINKVGYHSTRNFPLYTMAFLPSPGASKKHPFADRESDRSDPAADRCPRTPLVHLREARPVSFFCVFSPFFDTGVFSRKFDADSLKGGSVRPSEPLQITHSAFENGPRPRDSARDPLIGHARASPYKHTSYHFDDRFQPFLAQIS